MLNSLRDDDNPSAQKKKELLMNLSSVGLHYIVRKLELKSAINTAVVVKIGFPQPFPDSSDYFCPFQIVGLGNEKIEYAGGIDAVQALILAMEKIGLTLCETDEFKNGDLHWEGSAEKNLGFPAWDSTGMLAKFY